MKKTCAITGHRDLPADFNKLALYEELERLIKDGCDTFLCGMAEGFDLYSLECLVSLRRKYRISIEACVPFPDQDMYFSNENKNLYRNLMQACEKTTVLSKAYYSGVYLMRDRYMVDHCDIVFAYCKKESGGTFYTVSYAKSKNVPVVYFG